MSPRALWHRILAHLRPNAAAIEMDEELRYHLDRETARNVSRGMEPAEARAAALRGFGNVAGTQAAMREAALWRWASTPASSPSSTPTSSAPWRCAILAGCMSCR